MRAAKALDARDAVVSVAPGRRPWVHVSARDVSYYDGVGAAVRINYAVTETGGPILGAHGGDHDRPRRLAALPARVPAARGAHVLGAASGARDIHGNRVRRTLTLVTR